MHKWYAQTTCPGLYLGSKFSYIVSEANKRLKNKNYSPRTVSDLYRLRKCWQDSKRQKDAFKKLESVKKLAKKYNYKVYKKNGNQVYLEVKESNKKGKLIKYEKWTGITLDV